MVLDINDQCMIKGYTDDTVQLISTFSTFSCRPMVYFGRNPSYPMLSGIKLGYPRVFRSRSINATKRIPPVIAIAILETSASIIPVIHHLIILLHNLVILELLNKNYKFYLPGGF